MLLVSTLMPLFAGCLSTEVSLTLAETGGTLEIRYIIPAELWTTGVFDEDSPERMLPVSERDARETANLYADVELLQYRLRSVDEMIHIETRYRSASDASLSALWGSVGTGWLSIDRAAGELLMPVGGGVGPTEPVQAELLSDLFSGQTARFSVDLSALTTDRGEVQTTLLSGGQSQAGADPGSGPGTAALELPMEQLVTSADPLILRAAWRGED